MPFFKAKSISSELTSDQQTFNKRAKVTRGSTYLRDSGSDKQGGGHSSLQYHSGHFMNTPIFRILLWLTDSNKSEGER